MPTSTAARYVRAQCSCCLTTSCSDAGCALVLPRGHGELACISGSQFQSHHKMRGRLCDCMIFWSSGGRDIFAPAELKGGHVKATNCLVQLQNAARLAQTLLGTAYQKIRFEPLIVHKGGLHTNEIKVLRNRRITFRSQRRLAALVKSGTRLATAVA